MKSENIHDFLQQKYQYDKNSPELNSNDSHYKVYSGQQKQIAIQVTIKILQSEPNYSLVSYLNKLKSVKSEQVIKIYEIINQINFLVIVTEKVAYGSIASALLNCKKLDESDSIFMAKYLLAGYMDASRSGVEWNGDLNDIQITETGIKLSWNNSSRMKESEQKNFRIILEQLSTQKISQGEQRLLPFPDSKQLKQLFQLAEASASEISLSPIMKKKQKYLKKKFKSYLLIRETKNSNEYYSQTVYLAISKNQGFLRIKMYPKGTINPIILELNKTKSTFTKLYEKIDQGEYTYLISAYSNDGSLQSYIQRLKSAGIQLKQDQIEFFFYSMMQPLKAIQQSSLKSLNTSLHIKNIYIQNGIPKIGEPIPMNEEIKEKFRQRAEVPDFYHNKFKQDPQISDPSHDTYSLGVLLHKLMFTEFPIFPENNKVKLPITPTFSPRLKKTLQIFLDEGGKLSQIQKKIEVSSSVLKQVKKNKELLLNAKKLTQNKLKDKKKTHLLNSSFEDDDIAKISVKDPEYKDPLNVDQENIQDDCLQCFVNLEIADHAVDPEVESLQESPYKTYRLCTKFFCFLLLYVLLMYMFYLRDNVWMLLKQKSLERINITISTIHYEIITEDRTEFYLKFNQTSRLFTDLQLMGCFVSSNQNNYYSIVQPNTAKWISFLCGGLAVFILIIILKSLLIFKFDYIKVKYNYQHNISNFNYSNFIIIHLLLACLINQHFQFFNLIFYTTLPACFGTIHSKTYSTTDFMVEQNPKFLYVHLTVMLSLVAIAILHFVMIHKTDSIKYSKLFNPILLFAPFMLAYWIVARIGVLWTIFYPSALNDSQSIIKNYFTQGDYIGILGIIPELLLLLEQVINKMTDLFYWLLIDKKRRVMIQQTSTENIQIYQ